MDARIVGWGHTPFGRLDKSLEELIADAANEALAHAGVAAGDVDAIYLGHYNAGMVPDGFASSLALQIDDDLRFTPATRLENACASGSAAVYTARNAIRAGQARVVLVIGVEKMTSNST
ncbi:MAG: acetyl-CoA C-acetyltransferase, partial [Paracoccaceae bacterium]